MGDYQKACEVGEKAVHIAHEITNYLEVMDAFLNQAEVLMFLERNTESLALLADFSYKIEKLQNISEQEQKRRMGIYNLLREINSFYLGDPLKTIDLLNKSVELLEMWGTEDDKAFCYSIYGIFHMLMGDLDKVLHFHTKSQSICTKLDSPLANFYQMRNFLGKEAIKKLISLVLLERLDAWVKKLE
ncbi:MAG: hypothetical protein ACTSWW_05340 [Promethearchaeota archaeon]